MKQLWISILGLALLWSCKPEHVEKPTQQPSTVTIKIKNVWENQPIVLHTQTYLNAGQDTFTISKFKYYLSNFKLTGPEGTFVQPYSYFLVDEDNPGSLILVIPNVPPRTYQQMSFGLGVDSVSNHSGPQTGALNTSNNMFWIWTDGYVFWKLEGNYRSPSKSGALTFHIGHDQNYKSFTEPIPTPIEVKAGNNYTLNLTCHVDEFFKNPTTIVFSSVNNAMGGEWTDTLANNTVDAFELKNE